MPATPRGIPFNGAGHVTESRCQLPVPLLLAISGIAWSGRWRKLGLMWVYISFNICGAVVLYYILRVRGMSLKPSGRIIRIHGNIAKRLFAR
jgi:hypothetical protein